MAFSTNFYLLKMTCLVTLLKLQVFKTGFFQKLWFFFIQIDKVSLLCSFDYAFRENCLDNVQSSNKLNFLTLADLDSLLDSKALDKTTPKRWQRKFFLEKNPSWKQHFKVCKIIYLMFAAVTSWLNWVQFCNSEISKCLKITEKVSYFSSVYILSGQKFSKMPKNGDFLKPQTSSHAVLPDRALLIGRKLVENAKIKTFKCDNFE